MCADRIKNRFLDGESIEELSRLYGMSQREIENLIRFSIQIPEKDRKSHDSPKGDY